MIDDAARTVTRLRDQGHVVLVHCVVGQSRTPAVAARYAMLRRGLPARRALREVCGALPSAAPNLAFAVALEKLQEIDEGVDVARTDDDDERAAETWTLAHKLTDGGQVSSTLKLTALLEGAAPRT